jgi:hypothetical protein
MNEELKKLLSKPTARVPEVGRVCFGLSEKGSYDAARGGSIPTIKIGGQYFVSTTVLRQMLGLESVSA